MRAKDYHRLLKDLNRTYNIKVDDKDKAEVKHLIEAAKQKYRKEGDNHVKY